MTKKQIHLSIIFFMILLIITVFLSYQQGLSQDELFQHSDTSFDQAEIQEETTSASQSTVIPTETASQDEPDQLDDDPITELESGRLYPLRNNIQPYTEELPPIPDKQENFATLHGVDSNNNYVRDDLEIAVVEKFEDDKDLVEAFFSAIRSNYWRDQIVLNEQFDEETLQKSSWSVDMDVACKSYLYGSSDYDWNNRYSSSKDISNQLRNTWERKEIAFKLGTATKHITGKILKVDTQMCLEYFQSTKTNPYSQGEEE
ncbi:hypothetical protein MK079_04865 [Candidatus Gracilibacteria bacterium]|nr:hypothetical protein [Candidatus Gracilibacteria bacterium]